MNAFAYRRLIAASVLSLIPVACDSETEEETPPTEWTDPDGMPVTWEPARPDGLEWTFKASTTYIKAPKSDLVVVTDSTLTFPASEFPELVGAAPGDVLIGNPHADFAESNPVGFLRKVTSIAQDGDELVVQTEGASLADAFEECDMVATWDLPSFGELEFVSEDGETISPESFGMPSDSGVDAQPHVSFDVDGTVLFDANGLKATVTKGSFEFTPTFHFELDAGVAKGLRKFSAVAVGSQVSELEVKLETTVGVDKEFTKEFSAGPLTIGLGPLSVQVFPKLVMGCSVDIPAGISVTSGVRASSSVALGVEFEKGEGLSGIAQTNFAMTRLGPSFAQPKPAEARCFITPSLDMKVSALVANASAKLLVEGSSDLSAELAGTSCKYDFDAKIKGTADVDITALGFDVVDDEFTLFEKNAVLANDANCIPKKVSAALD